jgi:tRNA A-37 threonylcarbamoyl transferase component Bud32
MARRLTCVHGHVWEAPDEGDGSSTGVQTLCPICGAVVDPAPQESPQRADPSSETIQYPGAVPISEAETVPPGSDSVPASSPAPGSHVPDRAIAGEGTLFPTIPGHEILDELGRGGMGLVLKARQTKLDRLVALKVLPPAANDDPAFAERFGREARALARLSHPHIVTVHDFGQVEGQSYLVMEFIAGMNLRQRLREGRVPLDDVLALMKQLCEALQYAHDEGIIHRDIKPENILLDKYGRARIADFGLAKLTVRSAIDYTLTGPMQIMGTWNYMAPEQFENPQSVDHRADIYALGVVFYEMLTGDLPRARFPLPSERGLDSRFDEIVLHALEREPERRYQSIREFWTQLETLGARATVTPAPVETAGSNLVVLLDETDTVLRKLQHICLLTGVLLVVAGFVLIRVEFYGALGLVVAASLFIASNRIRQVWEVTHKGHLVRFENGVFSGSKLFVDGVLSAHGTVGSRVEMRARLHQGDGQGDWLTALSDAGLFRFRLRLLVEAAAATEPAASLQGSPSQRTSDANQPPQRPDGTTERPPLKPIGFWIVAVLFLVVWPAALLLIAPVLIWIWRTLRQPDGKALLNSQIARLEELIRSIARHTVGSTAAWAIVTSITGLVAGLQPFLPVAKLVVLQQPGSENPLAAVYPYSSTFGIVPAVVFGFLLVFHIAIPMHAPSRLVRAALLVVGGMVVLGVTVSEIDQSQIYASRAYEKGRVSVSCVVLGNSLHVTMTSVGGEQVVEIQSGTTRTNVQLAGASKSLSPDNLQNLLRISVQPAAFVTPVLGSLLIILGGVNVRILLRMKHRQNANE